MDHKIIIETPRLLVREWESRDWLQLRELAQDTRVMENMGNGALWTDEQVQDYVTRMMTSTEKNGWCQWPLIYKADNRFAGFCGFNDAFLPDVELGWWLRPEYWGQGLAPEAAGAILRYGFSTWKFPRVISVTQPRNQASIRVMQKIGMKLDRTFELNGSEVVAYAIENPAAHHAFSGNLDAAGSTAE